MRLEKIVSNDGPGSSPGNPSFPLSDAVVGDSLIVTALLAGKELGRRLADLGLPIGSRIEVMHRQRGGRMIVARDFSRVALGAGMADKILVTRVNGEVAE